MVCAVCFFFLFVFLLPALLLCFPLQFLSLSLFSFCESERFHCITKLFSLKFGHWVRGIARQPACHFLSASPAHMSASQESHCTFRRLAVHFEWLLNGMQSGNWVCVLWSLYAEWHKFTLKSGSQDKALWHRAKKKLFICSPFYLG